MKTKVLLSAILICLFLCGFTINTNADTHLDDITYPGSVRSGEIIEINIFFMYPLETDCLHGPHLWLFYDIGVEPVLDCTHECPNALPRRIDILSDYPRPANVSIKFNSTTIGCEANDTFLFKIKFNIGELDHNLQSWFRGSVFTDDYEIAIKEPRKVSFSAVSIVAPVLILSIIVLVGKKKKGIDLK